MEKYKNDKQDKDLDEINKNDYISDSDSLDDEQRIKVLSPSMLVAKRFVRNKLAIIGTVIIVAMFLFSFIGGLIMPYGESQVFMGYESMSKEYASVTVNTEYRFTPVPGKEFPLSAQAKLILAISKNDTSFESQGVDYNLLKEGENFYKIGQYEEVASAMGIKGVYTFTSATDIPVSGEMEAAFKSALDNKEPTFELNDQLYSYDYVAKVYRIYEMEDLAIASLLIFDQADSDANIDYEFRYAAEKAINAAEDGTFTIDNQVFELESDDDTYTVYLTENGVKTQYADISNFVVQPISSDIVLTTDFRDAVKDAVNNDLDSFSYVDSDGNEDIYKVTRKDLQYIVRKDVETQLIKLYEFPSKEHLLGTDGNGMDILTRLMYGGKVSLMIGFIVVIIETFLGIVLGGIAGYFGKWVDNLIMRIVDIFNCIPSMPLLIILGSVMDSMKIDPQIRIYSLMLILGLLGWPGIARLVRGQILSLREQEFMTATEASGISVYRRIFKHLVPNVIPQLIVMATMGLGSIILTEATLSFLGLGVKFPFASWGNIVTAVSNVHVMTNYWFVWIPAGFLILITVLGFNFVGDGLRDAFDPKMKR